MKWIDGNTFKYHFKYQDVGKKKIIYVLQFKLHTVFLFSQKYEKCCNYFIKNFVFVESLKIMQKP